MYGSRRYAPGHKPVRINKTHEERTIASKKMWDTRGRRGPVIMSQCLCGCGTSVIGKWVRGHYCRMNNPSKLDNVRLLRSAKFKKMHEDGVLPPWNHGLTKDDPRVAKQGMTFSKLLTQKERNNRSVRMRTNRLDGTVPTLRGPDHSQWKGGVSRITERMRGSHQMYKLWKLPILHRDSFACQKCGKNSTETTLHVHHDKERFAEIAKKIMFKIHGDELLERELTFDEATIVVTAVENYHVSEHVSGITLCVDCHSAEHGKKLSERS